MPLFRAAVTVITLCLLAALPRAAAADACSAAPSFADNLVPTNHIHVAPPPAGSNSTGDGSAAAPFATIAFAAQSAAPGTAIVIHSGVYAGGTYLENLAGTAAAPIWIGGAPGEERPIIDGSTEGLHLTRCRYLVLHDLEVRNASGNGVNADDGGDVANPLASHHLLFRNLFIHDIGGSGNQDGLKLSGINDFAVIDCRIERCGGAGSGSGIDMVGCHRGLIARCALSDLSGSGVQTKGGSDDVEIRWNRFVNAGLRGVNIGGSTGFDFFRPPLAPISAGGQPNFEARNIRVLANSFRGSQAPIAFVGCIHSVVAHNTIIDPTRWLLRILQETVSTSTYAFAPCGSNSFASNLLHFNRSALNTHINIGGNTQPATFTFTRNLWYAHDNPQSTPTLPVAETSGIYGQDPLLLAPGAGDYRIPADSPAAGNGLAPPAAGLRGDIDGACWCETPSIGAFEKPRPANDFNCDGAVNVDDLIEVILAWGPCSMRQPTCPADVNGSGAVDVDDLIAVILSWT